ncbi:MAG: GNAT family N-acetyltransferase [Candidatus Lokiarchaeota archaeon]|nr:GNAT family N-acetyltransferase [Candidatus Lokiarchaeota archaeon]MBD3338411.1 GNAT family N-acetyltransferase [Candidatus Lokiarchaeota archaeon]
MKIKEVQRRDISKIIHLERKVFNHDAFSKEIMKKLIKNHLIFLKLEKGRRKKHLVGFVIVIKDRKDRANLINFVISPKYQNCGFGTILLRQTIFRVKEFSEISKIVLNVNTKNEPAINLYKQFNFQIIQKIDQYYHSQESAYLMELAI